ncbi:MAG: hypothetical protein WAN43_01430 [Rhodomicrobium sp.]|jgi:predicted  nucleic acid-binding Zn-ribbon protein
MANVDLTFISKQIEGLGERFGRVEERMDKLEARLDKMESGLDKIDGNIRKLGIQFATLKGSVKETEATMQSIAKILVDQGLATID